ncbi:unnamed protein product (mitochondrion) [Musa acuminata var. zebrina]
MNFFLSLRVGFGAFHVTGLYDIWVSYPYGLTGEVKPFNPAWGAEGERIKLLSFGPGGIASHQIAAGTFGGGLFHLSVSRSILRITYGPIYFNCTFPVVSRCCFFAAAFVVAGTMWYGSATTPISFFGPTRNQWIRETFRNKSIYRRVSAPK